MGTQGRRDTAGTEQAWYRLETGEVLARLGSTPEGLSSAEAAGRLQRFGINALPARRPPGLARIFLHQFFSPLIYILLVAGGISLGIGDRSDALFIFAVIFLNAALGTVQEWKAERSAADLQRLLQIVARVRRAGREITLPAEELVPGDVVLLSSGSRVPADLRLLQCRGLCIDESLLTGESQAVAKSPAPLPAERPLGERLGMAYAGTTVSAGRGLGVVTATGGTTQVGGIARAVTTTAAARPPLVIRMERFARQVSYLVLGFVALLAAVSLAQGRSWTEVFFMAVALAVSAIPEGLPVAITVALSIATSRMARRNVIVRKLTAVEGLGSCTCIASDKTGTLTANRQSLEQIWLPEDERFTVTGEGDGGDGMVFGSEEGTPTPSQRRRLAELARIAALCNEATLEREGQGWRSAGDAMDVACLALAWKLGLDPQALRRGVTPLEEIPYESDLGYAACCFREEGNVFWALKGAVERLLPFCTTRQTAAGPVPLTEETVQRQARELAAAGYRVLGVAAGDAAQPPDGSARPPLPHLRLLGLIGFIDPLRPGVREAVATCRRAGVRVVMITGDHPQTALTIARELGIAQEPGAMVSGAELAEMEAGGAPLEQRVATATVYARVSPLQKLAIVRALGRLGHFTAVTGDGVNDAPALRQANIGVAMGSGTDVAKDTAEIIVADDHFASIVAGIEEGRFAYDNIRKVTYLLISTGAAEILLFSLALGAGLPLPLSAVQLLWLNLVTNGIQDVALAFEGGEPGVMERRPRAPQEGLFNRRMIEQTVIAGLAMGTLAFAAWWWMLSAGWPAEASRNATLMLMVLLENVHVFNCRSEGTSAFRVPLTRNPLLIAGVLTAQGIHILTLYLPPMQTLLGVAPLALGRYLGLLLLASLLVVVMEFYKRIRSRRPESCGSPGGNAPC